MMLEVDSIGIRYGGTMAVWDLSLEVAEGEIVSLIGPNGAGKSSTLSCISGVIRPDKGVVRFDGRDIAGLSPEKRVAQGMSLVPEGRQIFSTLTVAENLRVASITVPRNWRGKSVKKQLDRFPALVDRMHDPAGALSGGQQQQLAIARALVSRPRLLLLDEPSLGLSPKIVDSVFEILNELREQGMTILLVEQNAVRASAFADRTYVLSSGRVTLEGTRQDLQDVDLLADSYLGSTQQLHGRSEASHD